MDIQKIREAVANALEPLGVLHVYGTVPDSPQVPCAIVYPVQFEYDATFDPSHVPQFLIWLLAGTVNMEGAQNTLDGWISTTTDTSIIAAIDADQTLGGVVSSATVRRLRSYGVTNLQDGGTRYLSAELDLEIYV